MMKIIEGPFRALEKAYEWSQNSKLVSTISIASIVAIGLPAIKRAAEDLIFYIKLDFLKDRYRYILSPSVLITGIVVSAFYFNPLILLVCFISSYLVSRLNRYKDGDFGKALFDARFSFSKESLKLMWFIINDIFLKTKIKGGDLGEMLRYASRHKHWSTVWQIIKYDDKLKAKIKEGSFKLPLLHASGYKKGAIVWHIIRDDDELKSKIKEGDLKKLLIYASKHREFELVWFILEDEFLKTKIKEIDLKEMLLYTNDRKILDIIWHIIRDDNDLKNKIKEGNLKDLLCYASKYSRRDIAWHIIREDDQLKSKIKEGDLKELLISASKNKEFELVWFILKDELLKTKIKEGDLNNPLNSASKYEEFELVWFILKDEFFKAKITRGGLHGVLLHTSEHQRWDIVWYIIRDNDELKSKIGKGEFCGPLISSREYGEFELMWFVLKDKFLRTKIIEMDLDNLLRNARKDEEFELVRFIFEDEILKTKIKESWPLFGLLGHVVKYKKLDLTWIILEDKIVNDKIRREDLLLLLLFYASKDQEWLIMRMILEENLHKLIYYSTPLQVNTRSYLTHEVKNLLTYELYNPDYDRIPIMIFVRRLALLLMMLKFTIEGKQWDIVNILLKDVFENRNVKEHLKDCGIYPIWECYIAREKKIFRIILDDTYHKSEHEKLKHYVYCFNEDNSVETLEMGSPEHTNLIVKNIENLNLMEKIIEEDKSSFNEAYKSICDFIYTEGNDLISHYF